MKLYTVKELIELMKLYTVIELMKLYTVPSCLLRDSVKPKNFLKLPKAS